MKEREIDLQMAAMYSGTIYAIRRGDKFLSSFFGEDNFQAASVQDTRALTYSDKECAEKVAEEMGAELEEFGF